jgi:hypothetical protein
MYGQHGSLAMTGVGASGLAFGLGLGWLLVALFVLTMAIIAVYTMMPRRMAEVAKVNPAAAAQMRLLS